LATYRGRKYRTGKDDETEQEKDTLTQVGHACGSGVDNELPSIGGIEVVEARADGSRGGLPSAQPIGQYGHTKAKPQLKRKNLNIILLRKF
jgi:hypothetical protein